MEDNMIWDTTVEENFVSVCKLLDIYGKAGMVMNSDKFQFGQETVSFAGMDITKDAIRHARVNLDAIRNFPVPKNISSLRSFYGMINQINYPFLMTEHMEPFCHLTSGVSRICFRSREGTTNQQRPGSPAESSKNRHSEIGSA